MTSHLSEVLQREFARGHKRLRVVGTDSLVGIAWTVHSLLSAGEELGGLLIVTPNTDDAWRMKEALGFFGGDCVAHVLPSLEVSPNSGLDPAPKHLVERMRFIWSLQQASSSRKEVFVASITDLLLKSIPFATFSSAQLKLKVGDFLPDSFAEKLQDWGYEREPTVEDCGKFAVRGGIIDVFPPNSSHALRLELFGDQIESIRSFSTENQRSLDEMKDCILIPAREVFYSKLGADELLQKISANHVLPDTASFERENLVRALNTRSRFTGMDFLADVFHDKSEPVLSHFSNTLTVFMVNPEECEKNKDLHIEEQLLQFNTGNFSGLKINPRSTFVGSDDPLWEQGSRQVDFSNLDTRGDTNVLADSVKSSSAIQYIDYKTFGLKDLKQGLANYPLWSAEWVKKLGEKLVNYKTQSLGVLISVENQTVIKKLQSFLEREGLHCLLLDESNPSTGSQSIAEALELQRKEKKLVHLISRPVPESIRSQEDSLVVIQHELLLGRAVRKKSTSAATAFQTTARTLSFGDLQPGDCIVHVLHGVGVYEGLKRLSIDGIENEYLQLSYKDKDKLYLPVYRLNQIQRYPGRTGTTVLDKLGGTQWEKAKSKARTGARDLALELLSLYAKRSEIERPPIDFSEDRLNSFETRFPFEETDDQAKAISDIEYDFRKKHPMDRLICGDVGFGKTEVAMRAAFMAASAGKQVAVLAPTTVLVFQHLETFKKRFTGENLEIRAVNRFVSAAETKEILTLTKEGKIHILIGTHRLLSKDVEFADLGLLVIDEEQRFGVAHKEKIRKMKFSIDTLAMSATPIPRSLNLSLMGIRDLSLINTAPIDRLPIRTYVLKWNDATIRSAILSEMKRGGQIYFIHNRVQSIYSVADQLRSLVPEARIRVGHGQMEDDELEKTMLAFYNKDIDVLLCTTIVESGMDVSSANTIIIDQAHTLGLSQLYQLRGRVGRSKQRAFCYLVTPKGVTLEKVAQERLKVIHDNTALGSGIRIAQYDLELRGAGEILGENQSGHIQAVGYEMYMDLLNEEIEKLRGNTASELSSIEPEINLRVPALIPEYYIPDLRVRLSYYKALSECINEAQLEGIESDLKDQFGKIPDETLNLFGVMLIRQKCKALGIKDVSAGLKNLSLIFSPQSPLKTEQIIRLATKENKKYSITPDSRLNIRLNNLGWPQALEELSLLEKLL